MTKQKHIESVKLDAANLPVRRSAGEGVKELGYGG
jgi:hypothetical protein